MKKIMTLLIAVVISVMTVLPCSAADTMFDSNDITVCNLYTDLITAKVAINSSGNVYYSCQVRGKVVAQKLVHMRISRCIVMGPGAMLIVLPRR